MVLFSYDIFSAQVTGGISRCMIELMRALSATSTDWKLWAGRHGSSILEDEAVDGFIGSHTLYADASRNEGRLVGSLRNELGFSQQVRRLAPEIVHRTFYPLIDLTPNQPAKRVETLHDMWDERAAASGIKSAYLKSIIKRRALRAASAIVCVSESTRQEMIEVWPELAPKAVVIHHGVRRLSNQPVSPDRDRPFFLFVGRREAYKNFSVTLTALQRSGLAGFDLVCLGGGAFDASETAEIAACGLTGRVVQLAGNDHRLAGMYEAAAALLYPSSYEGFGLPLLEAMVHGCPVIAAPWTSLPETGGHAAIYADPARPDDWASLMAKVVEDSPFRDALRAKGHVHAADFTWSRTAKEHIALYNDLGFVS